MKTQSRRQFLKDSGTVVGGSWLSVNLPVVLAVAQTACSRKESGAAWRNISTKEAEVFAAVVDQIIPPDETPGASEAGVVYFIDEALGGFMQGAADMLREGLADLDRRASGAGFASLDFDRQTAVLAQVEESPFFGTMLFLTQAGMFAMPQHGGNRDEAGWSLLGFDHRNAWQPPFGYYDAQLSEEGTADVQS
ncbi:MAG TPA: gluconate 2-dehydrogenase subunit 3 family protein [Xanthomonadales bacterium]|nr:gluconate 2-dehydrogenase subunit 3 family protein [Xanthomonadales bacterium]